MHVSACETEDLALNPSRRLEMGSLCKDLRIGVIIMLWKIRSGHNTGNIILDLL